MYPKKIALVGFRLSGGGSDRVMANLSNYFSEKGIDVHIIIFHDELGYPHSGTVFNLGKLKSNTNTIFNKIKRFYHFNKYIKQHQFDFIIDFRFRVNLLQEILISKWIYNTKTIYTVHSSKLNAYMPDYSKLTRWIYGKNYAMIAITKDMQEMIVAKHKLKNINCIHNPIDIDLIAKSAKESIELDFQYIIGVGRYDTNVKQFDKLMEAYSKSVLPSENIQLVILGTGKLKSKLSTLANKLKVSNLVHFIGFKTNPYRYLKNAKFFVLSSKFEGLPMVMLEALATGTPVISYDCQTGPSEIIHHLKNGVLVENQNVDKLAEGMNTLIEDETLYNICKNNAQNSVQKFSVEIIGEQWMNLMNADE